MTLYQFVRPVAHPGGSRVIRPELDTPEAPVTLRRGMRKRWDVPTSTWVWAHNLGVRPSVVATVNGEVVVVDVVYINDDTLSVENPSPSTGYLDIV